MTEIIASVHASSVEPPQPKIIVAMPAFNEEKYIGSMVLATKQYADEVLVVDDGSTDQTSKIAILAGATVIRHAKNRGYGAAIQSIFSEAKRRSPEALVLIDADGQHHPADIPSLIKPITEGSDLVIGSRELQHNRIPFYRRLGQKVILHSGRILSRKKLSDSESGFRVFSRKAISVLELKENGMSISAETIVVAAEKGLKITEVPISVTYTKDGSTLNPLRHGFGVMARITAMISERRPLFLFGGAGSILVLLGLAVAFICIASEEVNIATALVSVLLVNIGMLTVLAGMVLRLLTRRK